MSDLPEKTNGSPTTRERAKDYQLEAIARLSVLGTPPATMAATVGLSEPYITRLLSGKHNETFNRLHDDYKRMVLKNVVGAHFDLAQKLPEALLAIGDALGAQDARLRFEGAKWVWDKIVPDFSGRPKNGGDSDTLQIILNQPLVRAEIGESMASVAQVLLGLREAINTQQEDQYVKLGTDALHTPPSQSEVSGGEAQLEPERVGSESDLHLEVLERDDS